MINGSQHWGLKSLRSGKGPKNPNEYWRRKARPKCGSCGLNIRSENHKHGSTK